MSKQNGKKIVEMRNDLGLTQVALAERCGISQGTLSKIESNSRGMSIGTLVRLSAALDVDMGEIMKG